MSCRSTTSTGWGAPEESPQQEEVAAIGWQVSQARTTPYTTSTWAPLATGAASLGGSSFQQYGVGTMASPTSTYDPRTPGSSTTTSTPLPYKERFVVRKHRPEAPEEQRYMVKNLNRHVLQSIDRILLTVRSRQPRTATGWDHGGPHDHEIEAIRAQISTEITRVFEEATTSQQDRIVELEGLVNEAWCQVSKLEKVLADEGLSRQGQAVPIGPEGYPPFQDVSSLASASEDFGAGYGTNDKGDDKGERHDEAEIASAGQSTVSQLKAVCAGQKKVEDMLKQLDEARKEFERASQELRDAQLSNGNGSGRTGGNGEAREGDDDRNDRNVAEGSKTTNIYSYRETSSKTTSQTPRETETGQTDGAWVSTHWQNSRSIGCNPSSSVKFGRQSTRRHAAADSNDWRAPVVGFTSHTSPASSRALLQKYFGMDGGGGGNVGASAAPVADGTVLRGSTESSSVRSPGESRR